MAGGIGAGKSHVARLLASHGCCRVDSDEMVRTAYTHPQVRRAVADRFGDTVIDPAGQVDRKALARIVFNDPDARRWLEQLLHPIANAARVEVMDAAARDPAIVAYVWDSPLLFETRLNELCDTVIFVDAPLADRQRRVAERGWEAAELVRRENAQWPLDKKRSAADHVVSNGTDTPATAESLLPLLTQIVNETLPDGFAGGCCGGGNTRAASGTCGCQSAASSRVGGCCGSTSGNAAESPAVCCGGASNAG